VILMKRRDAEMCGQGWPECKAGPWATHADIHQSQRLKLIGTLMRQDALSGVNALRPLLLNSGYREETFNEWVKLIEEEINTIKRPIWTPPPTTRHYQNTFDLIHVRIVSAGFRDFRKTKQDIEKCLKPGGLVVWIDVDYHLYDENPEVYLPLASENNPEGSWMARIIW
ncbi:13466_t:CDS:2, partial [Acaulospora colombiana]